MAWYFLFSKDLLKTFVQRLSIHTEVHCSSSFPTLFLKAYFYRSYFPLGRTKGPLIQSSMKTVFSHNMFKILMLWQLVNFLLAIQLSSDFYKVQISTNYEKIIFTVPSIVLPFCPSQGKYFV